MDAWESAEEEIRRSKQASSDAFIKLSDDGDRFLGVFLGDPHRRQVVWNDAVGYYEEFTAKHREEGLSPVTRYRVNVYLTNESKIGIWEMTGKTFEVLLKARTKHGLTEWVFEVERNGGKGDTRTTYSITKERAIEPAERQKIQSLELLALGPSNAAQTSFADASPPKRSPTHTTVHASALERCIDHSDAGALYARLKSLPKDQAQAFFAKFQIARLTDLRSAYLPQALRLVEQFEQINQAPPPPAENDDEFSVDSLF